MLWQKDRHDPCPFGAVVYWKRQRKRVKQMNRSMTNCGKCCEGSKTGVKLGATAKMGPPSDRGVGAASLRKVCQ